MRLGLLVAFLSALIGIPPLARGDVFPAGYTFTYHFDSLPLVFEPTIQTAEYLSVDTGGVRPLTSTLSWEMFEGLPIGTPVASGTWSGFDTTLAGIPHGTWQDGEGSFRISVVSGAQLINDVTIYLPQFRPSGGYTGYVYELTVTPSAIPEPAAPSLIFFSLLAMTFSAWHSRKPRPAI